MTKAVIFDVDGTLVDSVDQHAHAWQDAFAELGYPVEFSAVRSQIGKGGDQLLPVFLHDAERERVGSQLEARRKEILQQRYLHTIKGFPKVRDLFEQLIKRGFRIALASSAKSDELSYYKRVADIEDLIDEQTSSDEAERSKPYPDIFQAAMDRLQEVPAEAAWVVGDTPYDAEAAGKTCLRTIGLLCGGFSESELRQAGCIAIYTDPASLLSELDRSPLGNAYSVN